jgi:hypothetical protein
MRTKIAVSSDVTLGFDDWRQIQWPASHKKLKMIIKHFCCFCFFVHHHLDLINFPTLYFPYSIIVYHEYFILLRFFSSISVLHLKYSVGYLV